jgi:hypothetical protein
MVLFVAAGVALVLMAAIVVAVTLAGIFRGSSFDEASKKKGEGREQRPR